MFVTFDVSLDALVPFAVAFDVEFDDLVSFPLAVSFLPSFFSLSSGSGFLSSFFGSVFLSSLMSASPVPLSIHILILNSPLKNEFPTPTT
jgi:hypothetical protein